jgi:hypothetical protein
MIKVSSGRASDAEGQVKARGRFGRLLSDHPVRVAATVLMFAGGFTITSSAYAQAAQDTASCVEKCTSDEKTCLNQGASEEMCDYDKKQCQKACGGSQ